MHRDLLLQPGVCPHHHPNGIFFYHDKNAGILVPFILAIELDISLRSQVHRNGWTALHFLSKTKYHPG